MPHTLALNIFAASFLEQTRAFLQLTSAEHCIVHRPQNNQRMANGCGFEIWSKNVGADDEFCDAFADEIIPHPRISVDNKIEHYTNIYVYFFNLGDQVANQCLLVYSN